MQDRFKCRMYDKKAKKMYSFENDCLLETTFECLKQQLAFDSKLNIFNAIAYDHIADGRIFMQCTGLKDKNGNLIYEEDIVKFIDIGNQTGIVEFVNSCALFQVNYLTKEDWAFLDKREYEVIGNVYQNPELLNKEVVQ